jgi:VanZ family protein
MTQDDPVSSRGRLRLIAAWYGLGVLMLLAVGVLSLMPVADTGVNDKLSHFVTYFLLAGWFGLLASGRPALLWTVAGLIAFGVLIELLQGMTSYRYQEWGDVLANSSGVVLGILLGLTPLRRLLTRVDGRLADIFER